MMSNSPLFPESHVLLSRSTKAAFIRVLATLGHSELSLLYYEYDVETQSSGGNRLDRARGLIRAIEEADEFTEGRDQVLDLLRRFLLERSEWEFQEHDDLKALVRSLSVDGYAVVGGRLVPSDPIPVSHQPATSAFEQDLRDGGIPVAARHLRQAIDSFVDGNFEASNSQIRSYFEDITIVASQDATGGRSFNNPNAALQALRHSGHLEEPEFHLFRHFWSAIQGRGPHRGLTSEEEALFRLHTSVSLGRYLLWKARR